MVILTTTLKGDERGAWTNLLAQNPRLEPPRKYCSTLVADELSLGYGKDIVEFFESALLGLWDKEENQAQGNQVETCVKCKCTRGCHGRQHTRERDG